MLFLFAILAFSNVYASPTTKVTTAPTSPTTTPTTTVPPTNPHVVVGTSTEPSNETDVEEEYVGIRGSIEKELMHLRSGYENMREDIDEWMSTPYHRNVVIPAAIGVMSAVVAVFLYHLVKATFRNCVRRFRRCRLSHMSRDVSGDKKCMLPKRDDSDDDDII
ncbi:hypothetical protein Y032_0802g2427 [Ancylostoma ceylanicum]|uniref:Uncharacterized protein n=1 Tax=Ancylostoma ceylanicum TaxID=53326 RepID=A0A016WDG6_9BILA|nr:hypothetical protein Y032_0802g2427 [Ancylostoma ceylanicum]